MDGITASESPEPLLPEGNRGWPWGQFGWFLVGIAFSLMGLGDVGLILGFVGPSIPEVQKVVITLLVLVAIGCSLPAVVVRRWSKQHGTQVLHLSWLRKVNYGLLAASVSLEMLSLTIPAIHAARVAKSKAVAAEPWSEHTFFNESFRISTPRDWELVPDPTTTTSGIHLTDRLNDLHLFVWVTPKQDLAVQSLTELSQQSMQTVARDITNVVLGDMQMAEVDGHQGTDLVMAGTFNGVNLLFYLRHVEYPDAWVQIRIWATRSRYQANEMTFSKIASSIARRK